MRKISLIGWATERKIRHCLWCYGVAYWIYFEQTQSLSHNLCRYTWTFYDAVSECCRLSIPPQTLYPPSLKYPIASMSTLMKDEGLIHPFCPLNRISMLLLYDSVILLCTKTSVDELAVVLLIPWDLEKRRIVYLGQTMVSLDDTHLVVERVSSLVGWPW